MWCYRHVVSILFFRVGDDVWRLICTWLLLVGILRILYILLLTLPSSQLLLKQLFSHFLFLKTQLKLQGLLSLFSFLFLLFLYLPTSNISVVSSVTIGEMLLVVVSRLVFTFKWYFLRMKRNRLAIWWNLNSKLLCLLLRLGMFIAWLLPFVRARLNLLVIGSHDFHQVLVMQLSHLITWQFVQVCSTILEFLSVLLELILLP